MRKFGLIGHPLSHSYSREYFTRKFQREGIADARYDLFDLPDINGFQALLAGTPGLVGMNVTIPYKQQIIPMLDSVDPQAMAIGAVNCIRVEQTGGVLHTTGYNTDAPGFIQSQEPEVWRAHRKALVLGTGGSAGAVAFALRQLGKEVRFVSRKPVAVDQVGYDGLTPELISGHTLIVNATPVGMYPDVEACPSLPYEVLTDRHLLYDLVYNPDKSKFLQMGEKAGAATRNGMEMLRLQAEFSWQIWNNQPVPDLSIA